MRVEMKWDSPKTMLVISGPEGTVEEVTQSEPLWQQQQQVQDPLRASMDGDRLGHEQWTGRQVEFMQENRHSNERNGTWDTDGLEGAAFTIVSGDSKSGRFGSSPSFPPRYAPVRIINSNSSSSITSSSVHQPAEVIAAEALPLCQ